MEDWVTTKQASEVKKVGLTAHRIAQLAKQGKIISRRVGLKKWHVLVTFNDGNWELVPITEQPRYAETLTVKMPIHTLNNPPSRRNRIKAEKLARELWPDLDPRVIDVTVTNAEQEPNTRP